MTTQQAKKVFNQIAAQHRANGDHDQAARIEIAREYFTNAEFKAAMQQYVWKINEVR